MLKTCSGTSQVQGRRAHNLVVESLDNAFSYALSALSECNAIPDVGEEIPTQSVARAHPHLASIADKIPALDMDVEILLLIGKDAPALHKIHESRNGPRDAPWAQRLDFGWVVLGNFCLDSAHKPTEASCFRTQVLDNGQPSLLQPLIYQSVLHPTRFKCRTVGKFESLLKQHIRRWIGGWGLFVQTKNSNKPGPSVEDRKFINIMKTSLTKGVSGNWEAPLPPRKEIENLPNKREDALKRLKSTWCTLDRNPMMKQHYLDFMQKLFDNGHGETVRDTELSPTTLRWYLPHFGVYHPQKPGKICVVFDSAAETKGASLNKMLLSGPDLTNGLLGILIRFCQQPVAFMADIKQMFHSFLVQENHRDLLRFFWYKDNNLVKELTEYRMKVYVFGNTSSPAIATYCLRETAEVGEQEFSSDAKDFVDNNFYVNNGLKSIADSSKAIDLLHRTQAMLATANLRLYKIASNHPAVTQAFPSQDRAA